MTRRLLVAAAAALVLPGCGSPAPAAGRRPAPVTQTVTIEAVKYLPAELTVHVGDHVIWVNKDPFPHTVTADSRAFDSKQIEAGASWEFVADTKGEFPYACTLHPPMKGVLRVQ